MTNTTYAHDGRERLLAEALLQLYVTLVGPGFHPDYPLEDLINTDTDEYLIPRADVNEMQNQLDAAIEVLDACGVDIYELCMSTARYREFCDAQRPELVVHPMFNPHESNPLQSLGI